MENTTPDSQSFSKHTNSDAIDYVLVRNNQTLYTSYLPAKVYARICAARLDGSVSDFWNNISRVDTHYYRPYLRGNQLQYAAIPP